MVKKLTKYKNDSEFRKKFLPKNPSLQDLLEKEQFYIDLELYELARFTRNWINDYNQMGIIN